MHDRRDMGRSAVHNHRQTNGETRPPAAIVDAAVRTGRSASSWPPFISASPGKLVLAARWAVVVAFVLVTAGIAVAAGSSTAQDGDRKTAAVSADGTADRGTTESRAQKPYSVARPVGGKIAPVIAKSMTGSVTDTLSSAFELAVSRVGDLPDCGALFEQLGCDGIDLLTRTLYIPAHPLNEESVCRRGATAFTMVGASQTWVCRRFSALNSERAAITLIHEALHHGGLTEAPQDPDAMNAREINTMVARACGF